MARRPNFDFASGTPVVWVGREDLLPHEWLYVESALIGKYGLDGLTIGDVETYPAGDVVATIKKNGVFLMSEPERDEDASQADFVPRLLTVNVGFYLRPVQAAA